MLDTPWTISGSAAVSALGLLALGLSPSRRAIHPAGVVVVMAMTPAYPQYVRRGGAAFGDALGVRPHRLQTRRVVRHMRPLTAREIGRLARTGRRLPYAAPLAREVRDAHARAARRLYRRFVASFLVLQFPGLAVLLIFADRPRLKVLGAGL